MWQWPVISFLYFGIPHNKMVKMPDNPILVGQLMSVTQSTKSSVPTCVQNICHDKQVIAQCLRVGAERLKKRSDSRGTWWPSGYYATGNTFLLGHIYCHATLTCHDTVLTLPSSHLSCRGMTWCRLAFLMVGKLRCGSRFDFA